MPATDLQNPAPAYAIELAAGKRNALELGGGERAATGTITFTANPSVNDSITLNSVVWSFAAAADLPNHKFKIEADLSTTLTSMVTALNASTDPLLDAVTYGKSGTTILTIAADEVGEDANDYTLASAQANAVVSAATLTGGEDQQFLDIDEVSLFKLNTDAGTAETYRLNDGDEGQIITIVLETKGTGANALVAGNFLGGTTLTLDTVGKWAVLQFVMGAWRPIVNTGSIA